LQATAAVAQVSMDRKADEGRCDNFELNDERQQNGAARLVSYFPLFGSDET
jgi:hypothetical protein